MEENDCSFSLELNSRGNLKSLNLNGDRKQGLLVQGSLGIIRKIEFQEDSVFVISGAKGEIRLDLTSIKLQSMLNREENEDE